ncbi:MAG: hypothetical protein MJB14_13660 [Spirochaetes bacterium]|nr:hypothetical protein [Spirochaetota bacterium]
MDLFKIILELEIDFYHFKRKYEQAFLFGALLYILFLTIMAVGLNKFLPDIYQLTWIKYLLMFLALFGLLFYYYLRSTFFKSNSRYRQFLKNKIDDISTHYANQQEFDQSLAEIIPDILKEKKLTINNYQRDIFLLNLERITHFSNFFQDNEV